MSKHKQNKEDSDGELKKRKRDDNKETTEKDQKESTDDKDVSKVDAKSPNKEKKEQKDKKQKKEDNESAPNTQAGNNNNNNNNKNNSQPEKKTVELGGLRFSHESEVYNHASRLLNDTRVGFKLSEKDKAFVIDLLRLGHENFAKKSGAGIADIKADMHSEHTLNKCFFVIRVDGTEEDFSYLKCVKSIFPKAPKQKQKKEKRGPNSVHKFTKGVTKYNKNKKKKQEEAKKEVEQKQD